MFIWIEKLINFINSIFFVLVLVALSFALIFSPPDYLQGDSVRIMYVHVPAAWIGLSSFTLIALLSILNFIFKIKNLTLITKSIAPIGFMFTCIAIVTGSIWGQPTWGTFWAWDARITSMVILALFYFIFITTHKLVFDVNKANKITNFKFSKSDFLFKNLKSNTIVTTKTQEMETIEVLSCIISFHKIDINLILTI